MIPVMDPPTDTGRNATKCNTWKIIPQAESTMPPIDMPWKAEKLLQLSDAVRTALAEGRGFGSNHQTLRDVLNLMLVEELSSTPTMEFETIEHAHLDKLFADILQPTHWATLMAGGAKEDLATTLRLQRSWIARFKSDFFAFDNIRYDEMVECGRLRDVSFSETVSHGPMKWKARCTGSFAEVEGNMRFRPGHWWLNLACAMRDGMVSTAFEKPTKGLYGVTALPLLTGDEEQLSESVVRYIRESKVVSDVHLALISQVGSQIRLLRGHKLKSVLAPSAGVRYDGLYKLCSYGHKLDDNTGLYRATLLLERLEGQRPMKQVRLIPRPSQLDDWELYEKFEEEKIRQREGETGWRRWCRKRDGEKMERDQWRRAREFRESFLTTTLA